MKRFILAVAAIAVLSLAPLSARYRGVSPPNVLGLMNEARSAQGLGPLTVDSRLTAAAESRVTDMVSRRYFGHKDPSGQYVWPLVKAQGYCYRAAAENLASGFRDAEPMHAAWMKSKGHRANILNPVHQNVGIGIHAQHVVVIFGKECG